MPSSSHLDNISECDDGYYGTNCLHDCGSCESNVTCNKSTGACPDGCDTWWITDTCHTYM